MPKSARHHDPSSSSTFSGFRSRWTTFPSRSVSASAKSCRMGTAACTSGASPFRPSRCSLSDLSARGMTSTHSSAVSPLSMTGTTLRTPLRSTKSSSLSAPGSFGTSFATASSPSDVTPYTRPNPPAPISSPTIHSRASLSFVPFFTRTSLLSVPLTRAPDHVRTLDEIMFIGVHQGRNEAAVSSLGLTMKSEPMASGLLRTTAKVTARVAARDRAPRPGPTATTISTI